MAIQILTGVALRDHDRLLLVRGDAPPPAGGWDLPGGVVEAGETIQAAARRALQAEVGVALALGSLVGIYSDARPAAGHTVRFVFSAYAPPERTSAGAGIAELQWAPLATIAAMPDEQIARPALLRQIVADIERGLRYPLALLAELS